MLHARIMELSSQPAKFLSDKGVNLDAYQVERLLVNEWGGEEKSEQIKVWLKPREPDIAPLLREALERIPPVHKVEAVDEGSKLALLSIFDLHVGMLAWGKESGEDYDTHIALDRLRRAASWLLSQMPRGVEQIVIPMGNDILHADNHNGTTAAGTRVDVDSRWQKAFSELVAALVNGPLLWATEAAPVHIVIVQGNHDYQRAFYLGEVLRWYFEGRGLPVTVDNAPRLRKYYLWGDILLGFTHGAWVKPKDLPLIMATEAAKEWGSATWREWVIGHFHAKRETAYSQLTDGIGVRVRVLPSLASEDAWHYQQGFVGRRPEATLTLYEARRGPVAEFFYRP